MNKSLVAMSAFTTWKHKGLIFKIKHDIAVSIISFLIIFFQLYHQMLSIIVGNS